MDRGVWILAIASGAIFLVSQKVAVGDDFTNRFDRITTLDGQEER